ncbi:MAG: DNA repair protein RecN [Ruminococcaceae bacterium]|nr:DNA repair protein RecN [Oscillospiraceae bacterium]
MLSSLYIENIAVIKKLELNFDKGFTVFTGETGAGKSIIIDSIRLILGARADKGLVRTGETEAYVSAVFTDVGEKFLQKLRHYDVKPDEEGNIILSRTITTDGKNKVKINGRTVPLGILQEAGSLLIGIHGQHDTVELLDPERHIEYLDMYAGVEDELEEFADVFSQMNMLKNKLKTESGWLRKKIDEAPKLKEQIKEIASADIKAGELKELDEKRIKLKNSEKLCKNVNAVYKTLYNSERAPGCVGLIKLATAALEKISGDVPNYEEYYEKLNNISLELEGIAMDIRNITDARDFDDPEYALEKIEERIDLIEKLRRKYGPDEKDILEYRQNGEKTLKKIEVVARECEEIKQKLAKLSEKAFQMAARITEKRKKAAEELEGNITRELVYLDLEKVRFKVNIEKSLMQNGGLKLQPNGCDVVEFLISPNTGEDLKPLAKVASGGEMSRVMMAFRCIFANRYGIPSMIFDEIDTGVSGKTSEKIGIKLRQISSGDSQVFCVTHSSQVSACATTHLKIAKKEVDGRTETYVTVLDMESRIEELSRIMGGIEITENIRKTAREMIENTEKTIKNL